MCMAGWEGAKRGRERKKKGEVVTGGNDKKKY